MLTLKNARKDIEVGYTSNMLTLKTARKDIEVGYTSNMLTLKTARKDIEVGYTPNAVAETTTAVTILTAGYVKLGIDNVINGEWGTTSNYYEWKLGKQLSGLVVGFVGLGRLGFAAAKRFKSFEPSKIVYSGHAVKHYASQIDAEFVSLKDLLNVSDFVIVTCSLTDTSRHLFNAEAFQEMKSSSIFINVSRGTVVDQDALYNALVTKQIAAAGLDVTSPEPLPTDHKLLSLPNCVITPHIGSATVETRKAMCQLTVDNILAGLNGDPLPASAY